MTGAIDLNHEADRRRAIRRALLEWFGKHARPLPWRKPKDAYGVWISEVMLQQTQVATVIPYYRRFLQAFPSAARLAEVPIERVLELWSGLGYYRRARHLHLAARRVAKEFGGRFPADYQQARSLPGVGHYTARAVLSIAYNLPYSVLDGNVARVVARLRAFRGTLEQPSFRRAAERELEALLSRRQPGNFNQALMELGQTICLPRAPRCSACPLRRWCQAYRCGRPESYPGPRPRRARELHYLATAIIRRTRAQRTDRHLQVAMIRGLDDGLMADLWNFPAAFGRSRAEAFHRLRHKLAAIALGPIHWEHAPDSGQPRSQLRHGITYRSVLVDVYAAEVSGRFARHSLRWFPLSRLPGLAVSQLARKIATSISQKPS